MVVMVGRISWGALGFEKPLALALLVQYRLLIYVYFTNDIHRAREVSLNLVSLL